ncbi:hypothetical protein Gpo141_00001265 [Globisporangium polare]
MDQPTSLHARVATRANRDVGRELVNYGVLVIKQTTLMFIYAFVSYVFDNLSPSTQPVFALVLPLIKLSVKNWINKSVQQVEDFKSEVLIFNIEISHSLYVAFTMQSATSRSTVFVIMAVDFYHSFGSLRRIDRLTGSWTRDASQPDSVTRRAGVFSRLVDTASKPWRKNTATPLVDSTSNACHPNILRLVLYMLETDKSILENSNIQIFSCSHLRRRAIVDREILREGLAQGLHSF